SVAAALAKLAATPATAEVEAEVETDDHVGFASVVLESQEDGHLPASESDSTPRSVAFGIDLRRAVRTIGPIVAADVIGLVTAGLLTQTVLLLIYPAAAQAVGWVAAAVAP